MGYGNGLVGLERDNDDMYRIILRLGRSIARFSVISAGVVPGTKTL
jgi:hypothetical protein